MNQKNVHWGVLLALGLILFVWWTPKTLRPMPAKARRAQLVNAAPQWVVSFSLTNLASTNTAAHPTPDR